MKLVRDKVPQMLILKGLNPEYRLLDVNDHNRFDIIKDKLAEVSGEAMLAIKSGNAEQALTALANLMDVTTLAAKQYDLTVSMLKQERDKKRATKGSFDNFTILINPNRQL
jgi:predicted house-cleaning noncanonical NTP pyrophosphatase (MazG superfamily)